MYMRVSNNVFNKYLKPGGGWNNLKPAQVAALKRARARPVINKAAFNDILATSNSRQNALQKVVNLENSGYRLNREAYRNFTAALNARSPKSPGNAFLEAKRIMSGAPTKTARVRYYAQFWKKVLPHERKVLAYFRDHGLWHARNYFKKSSPSVKPPIKRKPKVKSLPKTNSPATARRKQVLERFKPFWNSTTSNNHKTIRNYIAAHKSPSPVKANKTAGNRYENALKNLNALKTAKARAEWLKAKKLNFKKGNLMGLKNYVKGKNQANKNRRAAKKA
jgi:bisphosphoglycerate-dependent phosphoglycerate mutase